MTAWQDADDGDWTARDFIRQFRAALAERQAILNLTPCTIPVVGADVQMIGDVYLANTTLQCSIAYIQRWITTYATAFVCTKTAAHGNYVFEGSYDLRHWMAGTPTGYNGQYYCDIFAEILGQAGWTRKYVDPTDGHLVETTGEMQIGDVPGMWLFDELRLVFNELRLTGNYCGGITGDYNGNGHVFGRFAVSGWCATEALAKAAAETAWDAAAETEDVYFVYPHWLQMRQGTEANCMASIPPGSFLARLGRKRTNITISPLCSTIAKDVQFGFFGHTPNSIWSEATYFNAFGDDVLESQYHVWDTQSLADTAASCTSIDLGNTTTRPAWNAMRHEGYKPGVRYWLNDTTFDEHAKVAYIIDWTGLAYR